MKYVINLPINFFASVRFIAKFTSCNGPKYHKTRNKSSGNNVIGVFSCVQAPCGVFLSSVTYIILELCPVTDVCGVVTLNPQK